MFNRIKFLFYGVGLMSDYEETIINVSDFGLNPNSSVNAVHVVRKCLEKALEIDGPCILEFPIGRYDFFPCEEAKKKYHISNTTNEEENPEAIKMIGILLNGNKDLIIEGNGSLFMFHGKMT